MYEVSTLLYNSALNYVRFCVCVCVCVCAVAGVRESVKSGYQHEESLYEVKGFVVQETSKVTNAPQMSRDNAGLQVWCVMLCYGYIITDRGYGFSRGMWLVWNVVWL